MPIQKSLRSLPQFDDAIYVADGGFTHGKCENCVECRGPCIGFPDPMGREEYVVCWHCGAEYVRLLDD